MKKKQKRSCKCCGAELQPTRLWICEECQAAGRTVKRQPATNTQELEGVARARQLAGMDPIAGMRMDEIAALAWTYRREGYGSYGKLRGYVHATGRLPERRF